MSLLPNGMLYGNEILISYLFFLQKRKAASLAGSVREHYSLGIEKLIHIFEPRNGPGLFVS
jgi:hypothetical protein